jgi:putative endonuclease
MALGRFGEERAARWYADHGYTLLERNWRCGQGEIDLLCCRGATLIICEVKARRSDRLGAPVEAVTRDKQLRLRRLAVAYLRTYGGSYDEVRFDVASVLGSELSVLEGAF